MIRYKYNIDLDSILNSVDRYWLLSCNRYFMSNFKALYKNVRLNKQKPKCKIPCCPLLIFQSEDVYSLYDYTPQEDFAEVLLRTGKLAETNSEGQNLFPATEGSVLYMQYTNICT